jgi:uncharacterized damage-inducible protein DinB
MSERKANLKQHIQSQHAKTWPILEALEETHMTVVVYSNDEQIWTVKDLLGHLADGERGNLGQAKRLAAGKQTVPEDFDLDRWNRSAVGKSKDLQPAELLERISNAFAQGLEFLDQLEEEQLDLVGRHASGQMLTTEAFLKRMADHRAEHVADIQAALSR